MVGISVGSYRVANLPGKQGFPDMRSRAETVQEFHVGRISEAQSDKSRVGPPHPWRPFPSGEGPVFRCLCDGGSAARGTGDRLAAGCCS
jgi:hypothetical protein